MSRAEHGALGQNGEEQGGKVTWDWDLGWEWLWEGTEGAEFPFLAGPGRWGPAHRGRGAEDAAR